MRKISRPAALLSCAAMLVSAAALAQTCNTADRSILLILDASGSMNARLPNGETRIAVAQRAIKGVASFIPAQTPLSLRMYGAQSAASQKNCQDTHLAVRFGPASTNGGAITTTVDGAKARGYTPIAYSLGQAANDFPADAKERIPRNLIQRGPQSPEQFRLVMEHSGQRRLGIQQQVHVGRDRPGVVQNEPECALIFAGSPHVGA